MTELIDDEVLYCFRSMVICGLICFSCVFLTLLWPRSYPLEIKCTRQRFLKISDLLVKSSQTVQFCTNSQIPPWHLKTLQCLGKRKSCFHCLHSWPITLPVTTDFWGLISSLRFGLGEAGGEKGKAWSTRTLKRRKAGKGWCLVFGLGMDGWRGRVGHSEGEHIHLKPGGYFCGGLGARIIGMIRVFVLRE